MIVYRVNEIFYTLQGEGLYAGRPAVFIRMSGCNLNCTWCDTNHASYKELSANEIAAECKRLIPAETINILAVLTGGEPSLQIDGELIDALHDLGLFVCIETNGTHNLPAGIDHITCSPKENSDVVIKNADEVKIVYTGQDVEKWRKMINAKHYSLQPCSRKNTKEVVEYILKHPWWRLSLQTHKIIDIK